MGGSVLGSAGSFLIQEEDENWYLYRLTMRDSMPLENADGRIRSSAPIANELQT